MKNITLSADEQLILNARKVAQQRGTSLNQLIRGYLRSLVSDVPAKETTRELLALMEEQGGHSGGERFKREDVYEGRV